MVISDWLVVEVSQRLDLLPDAIDVEQVLVRYGIDSIGALELLAALEDWLGCSLPLTLVWEYPTIQAIARYVAQLVHPDSTLDADIRAWITSEKQPPTAPQWGGVHEHPISYEQRALWSLYQSAPDNTLGNLMSAGRIRAELDIPALQQAFQQLLDRHPALRTTFALSDGKPVQRVHEHMEVRCSEEDASHWSEEFLQHCLSGEAYRPFDLERGPLLRLQLFSRSPQEHIFLLVVHHIIADFWSLVIFVYELEELYQAVKNERSATLSPLRAKFTDFVHWQTDLLNNAPGQRLWNYWKQQLSGPLPILNLPIDRRRPLWRSYRGASQPLKLDLTLTKQLKALSLASGTTLFTTLLATLYVLLSYYTDQEDLVVGSQMAGRSRPDWLSCIGHFTNPVALRTNLAGNPTFETILKQTQQTVEGAFEHQDYPFSLLVERCQPQQDLGRRPFPQVMFIFKKAHQLNGADLTPLALGIESAQVQVGKWPLSSIPLDFVSLEQHLAQCDLTLTMGEIAGELSGSLQYNTSLFDPTTILRMRNRYQKLLEIIVNDTKQPLATIRLALHDN